jgi:hypothetical protein
MERLVMVGWNPEEREEEKQSFFRQAAQIGVYPIYLWHIK